MLSKFNAFAAGVALSACIMAVRIDNLPVAWMLGVGGVVNLIFANKK